MYLRIRKLHEKFKYYLQEWLLYIELNMNLEDQLYACLMINKDNTYNASV